MKSERYLRVLSSRRSASSGEREYLLVLEPKLGAKVEKHEKPPSWKTRSDPRINITSCGLPPPLSQLLSPCLPPKKKVEQKVSSLHRFWIPDQLKVGAPPSAKTKPSTRCHSMRGQKEMFSYIKPLRRPSIQILPNKTNHLDEQKGKQLREMPKKSANPEPRLRKLPGFLRISSESDVPVKPGKVDETIASVVSGIGSSVVSAGVGSCSVADPKRIGYSITGSRMIASKTTVFIPKDKGRVRVFEFRSNRDGERPKTTLLPENKPSDQILSLVKSFLVAEPECSFLTRNQHSLKRAVKRIKILLDSEIGRASC